jgi:hypothetical protein
MDGPSYTPFNLGLRHHAFGPYAPHLQAAKYTCDDDMAIITEEVEEDIVIQEDASEFDAEVEVEEIDEIYVSDEEPPADTSSVEIISLFLITIRIESDGVNSVKREHHFSTSKHHDPRNFNWREFLSYMEEEMCRHAEALRKREWKQVKSAPNQIGPNTTMSSK